MAYLSCTQHKRVCGSKQQKTAAENKILYKWLFYLHIVYTMLTKNKQLFVSLRYFPP